MIALSLTVLFVIVSLASVLGLADCWLRGRHAFLTLKRERALAKAGFVPMIEAEELRLRRPARFVPTTTRPFARQLPARSLVPALGAA